MYPYPRRTLFVLIVRIRAPSRHGTVVPYTQCRYLRLIRSWVPGELTDFVRIRPRQYLRAVFVHAIPHAGVRLCAARERSGWKTRAIRGNHPVAVGFASGRNPRRQNVDALSCHPRLIPWLPTPSDIQPFRIAVDERLVVHIRVRIQSAFQPNRITRNVTADAWVIVSVMVVVY